MPHVDLTQSWGTERRYLIAHDHLMQFHRPIYEAIYRHHSTLSRVVIEELTGLGYSQTAREIEILRSGLPVNATTQSSNFVEVLGAEYARWLLGFDSTQVFPKHLNPNIDQSMKGPDIVGVRTGGLEPALLFGEAKWRRGYEAAALTDAHKALHRLITSDAARTLYLWRNVSRQARQVQTIDQVLSVDVKRTALIVCVTGNTPAQQFEAFAELCTRKPIPHLILVHIEIPGMIQTDFEHFFVSS